MSSRPSRSPPHGAAAPHWRRSQRTLSDEAGYITGQALFVDGGGAVGRVAA